MHVILVHRPAGDETVVGVRSLRTGRALFACVGRGAHGAALALVEAVAFCARGGHTIVTPAGVALEVAAAAANDAPGAAAPARRAG